VTVAHHLIPNPPPETYIYRADCHISIKSQYWPVEAELKVDRAGTWLVEPWGVGYSITWWVGPETTYLEHANKHHRLEL